MTMTELKKLHAALYAFIINEKKMRERVFPKGHPSRDTKLIECDKALMALAACRREPTLEASASFQVYAKRFRESHSHS